MGNKTHPIGFRLGIVKDWQTKWFAQKPSDYRRLVIGDMAVREYVYSNNGDAGISRVDIERGTNEVAVTVSYTHLTLPTSDLV